MQHFCVLLGLRNSYEAATLPYHTIDQFVSPKITFSYLTSFHSNVNKTIHCQNQMNTIYFIFHVTHRNDVFQQKVRSKPVFLVTNEKESVQTTKTKSPQSSSSSASASPSAAEQTQHKSFIPEDYGDTRVRRAFLWIKVDAIKSKKKLRENFVMAKNSTRKLRKSSVGHQRQRTFRNFFRLWVFQVVESSVSL